MITIHAHKETHTHALSEKSSAKRSIIFMIMDKTLLVGKVIYITSVYVIISLTPFSHANIFDATANFCQRARVTAEIAASNHGLTYLKKATEVVIMHGQHGHLNKI